MTQAIKAGDTISVHYIGKLEDGNIFDSSRGRAPLKFTVGADQVIPGFDNAVLGMTVGDKKTVSIPQNEGYGEHMDELIIAMPKADVPPEMKLSVGMMVQLTDEAGNPVPALVVEMRDTIIVLDANHPLAGKTLVFDIEIVETGLAADIQGN
jgi:peptidylprolyl isomerase